MQFQKVNEVNLKSVANVFLAFFFFLKSLVIKMDSFFSFVLFSFFFDSVCPM